MSTMLEPAPITAPVVLDQVESHPSATTPRTWQTAIAERLADYAELSKLRIAVMVLVTVSVGYLLGLQGEGTFARLWPAWLGITLVAAGSSALNQWFEHATDSRMHRTRRRPLPSGRMSRIEVLVYGLTTAVLGTIALLLWVNTLTAILTATTFVLYAFIYTPLKRHTAFCTAIGAIPGALPPVLGWTATGQPLNEQAFALFAVLFLWQFPHFLAIAWLYRDDYAQAGLRMLPGTRPQAGLTGLLALGHALCLLPVSLLPMWSGLAGTGYAVIAVLAGGAYVAAAAAFAQQEQRHSAKRLILVSLVYLPLLQLALAGDHWRLLQGPF